MFEEYSCGCILSRFQGRVRVCAGHRNVVEHDERGWRIIRRDPTDKVVCRYPANGEG